MNNLRGQLLIAGPGLIDPNFHRTVVLVGEHNDDGALGLVLNRPSPVSVAEAAPPLAELVPAEEPLFVGGPVQPQSAVVLAELARPERVGRRTAGERDGGVGLDPGARAAERRLHE